MAKVRAMEERLVSATNRLQVAAILMAQKEVGQTGLLFALL